MSGPYRVILADPPWKYKASGPWGAHRHYSGLGVKELCALPIASLTAKNAALFMWVTSTHLPEALQVMTAWGFTFRSIGFVWLKVNRDGTPFVGMGYPTQHSTEICILGLKGKMKRQAAVSELLRARRRQHSRKPDLQYERIMRLYDGPYLELFARQQWPGWDVWGNQAGKFASQPFLFAEASA